MQNKIYNSKSSCKNKHNDLRIGFKYDVQRRVIVAGRSQVKEARHRKPPLCDSTYTKCPLWASHSDNKIDPEWGPGGWLGLRGCRKRERPTMGTRLLIRAMEMVSHRL